MKCPKCKGIGAPWNNSASVPCDLCNGSGRIHNALRLVPAKRRCTLNKCPVGLFIFGDTLAVMTEYATNTTARQRDAYIVGSGEYFWGGASDPVERAKLLVTPCKVTT